MRGNMKFKILNFKNKTTTHYFCIIKNFNINSKTRCKVVTSCKTQ